MGYLQSFVALLGMLPLGFLVCMALLRFAQGVDRPRALLDAYLAWTIVSYAATEIFSFFHHIAFVPYLILWIIADCWLLYRVWSLRDRAHDFWRCEFNLPFIIMAVIVLITLFIALTTAPNNFDSQTYHLPRIEHWIQDGSLEFYPTSIERQNEMGPLAEVLLLQARVLSGSDFFYPLVQWLSMLCSVAAVFRITRQLGGSEAQCWIAAVFLATLPIGILESTSTQNDYVVAALLACFVTLGLEAIGQPRPPLGLVLTAVAAVGLSGIVKPVGYLVGSGFALWFAIALSRRVTLGVWLSRAATTGVVLGLILAPAASRYLVAHGTAQSDLARWSLNGSFGVKQTLDNLIRDGMLNFNTGIPKVDAFTNRAVESITYRLGLDTYRQDTSEDNNSSSMPPVGLDIFNEDYGPNLLHSVLVIVALIFTAIRWPTTPRVRLHYWGAWLIGIVVFAAILRWNLYQIRYHLPAFALVTPVIATVWPERWALSRKTGALFLIMGLSALPALMLNQTRALIPLSPTSYLMQPYIERLFVNQPRLLEPYRNAVDVIVRSNASQIGLVLGGDSWEYPIWRMLRDRKLNYSVRIEHVALPENLRWPLGSFSPGVVFWSDEDAPLFLTLNGQKFRRVGPPGTVAVFTPAGPS